MAKRSVLARDIPRRLDEMADGAIALMPEAPYTRGMITPLLEAIDASVGEDDIEQRLIDSFNLMDARAVERAVERAAVTATLIGAVSAKPVRKPPVAAPDDGV